jgi:hypothetical protein
MSNPTKLVLNCETGEQTVVELTDAEVAQMEADSAAWAAEEAARAAAAETKAALKASAKAKLIAGQPLTEAEAAVIVL